MVTTAHEPIDRVVPGGEHWAIVGLRSGEASVITYAAYTDYAAFEHALVHEHKMGRGHEVRGVHVTAERFGQAVTVAIQREDT